MRIKFWRNYNNNKDLSSVSRLFFCGRDLCERVQSVRYEMKEMKRSLKDARRLETNERVGNHQQLAPMMRLSFREWAEGG